MKNNNALIKTGLFAVFIIIGLIYVMNYPLSIWIASTISNVDRQEYFYVGYLTIYTFVAFFTVACCLYMEQDNLENFHFDKLSLAIFAFSGLWQFVEWFDLLAAKEFSHIWILLPTSLFILYILIRKWKQLPNPNWRWVFASILIALFVLIPATFIDYWYTQEISALPLNTAMGDLFTQLGANFKFSLAFVRLEEVIFRGLLWGYLRKLNWKENSIFVVQAVLFWFAHPGNMAYPLIFFVSLPLIIFATSFIVKRSRQLFPAMVCHLLYNLFVGLIWQFLVK